MKTINELRAELAEALKDRVALAMQVGALTQNLDGHKTQAEEDFALIASMTEELDRLKKQEPSLLVARKALIAWAQAQSDGNSSAGSIDTAENFDKIADMLAADAQRVPMTDAEIRQVQITNTVYSDDPWDKYYAFARGIEAHFGINP